MDHSTPDFGTGQKKLSIYVLGFTICVVLTLLSFWAVISGEFSRSHSIAIIYSSALIQFVTQVVCFLRLNAQTEQGITNILSLMFVILILVCIVSGSLWIMHNLNYNLM